ncbi:MAG: HEAT repeat domain-containing protein [Archangiaceae bacterium]|nr:HEAT repeat domain-containing protein [Archangiaceae bacterium]
MWRRFTLLLVFVWAVTAVAGSKTAKAQAVRAEAQDLVDAILRGDGNLNGTLSRVHYLGQEGVVSLELAETVRRAGDLEQLRRIAQALGALAHPNGEGALLYLLNADDGAIRMSAVQGLGRLRSVPAGPRLVPLLQDKSMGVRREAARALGLLHYAKAGPALMKAAKTEPELEVRAELLVAAGASGDKKQAPLLEGFLDDSSESARFAAAQGLCLLGHKRGYEFAKKKLGSPDRFERLEGLRLFEGTRAREVNAVLAPMLDDRDRGVSATAARILYQGGDLKMLDWLVVKSFQATGDDKLPYERELETLRLADDHRREILAKAGIK